MDRDSKELEQIAEANRREWQRLVEDNRQLQSELYGLRQKYNCPKDERGLTEWFARLGLLRAEQFQQAVETLQRKHRIPARWCGDFLQYAACSKPLHGPSISLGFPLGRYSLDKDGRPRSEIIIDAETAVNNRIVQDYIRQMHRTGTVRPPQPRSLNRHGQLDWQPVWEWHRQHPDVTLKEIAEMLGYSYGYVRQRMLKFDEDI